MISDAGLPQPAAQAVCTCSLFMNLVICSFSSGSPGIAAEPGQLAQILLDPNFAKLLQPSAKCCLGRCHSGVACVRLHV